MELKSDEKKICSHYCIGPIVLSNYTTRHFPVIGHFFMTLELEMSLRMSDRPKILLPMLFPKSLYFFLIRLSLSLSLLILLYTIADNDQWLLTAWVSKPFCPYHWNMRVQSPNVWFDEKVYSNYIKALFYLWGEIWINFKALTRKTHKDLVVGGNLRNCRHSDSFFSKSDHSF